MVIVWILEIQLESARSTSQYRRTPSIKVVIPYQYLIWQNVLYGYVGTNVYMSTIHMCDNPPTTLTYFHHSLLVSIYTLLYFQIKKIELQIFLQIPPPTVYIISFRTFISFGWLLSAHAPSVF